jgi:hypothetical protein
MTQDLDSIWQQVLESTPLDSPEEVSARGCPPLARMVEGLEKGFAVDELHHVSRCSECQNTVSLYWRTLKQCPSLWTVFQYLAKGSEFEYAAAIDLHLRRDGCPRCARRLRSQRLMELADLWRAGKDVERYVKAAVDLLVPGRVPFVGVASARELNPFAQGEFNTDQSAGVTVMNSAMGQVEMELVVAAAGMSAAQLELVTDEARGMDSFPISRKTSHE